MNLLQACADPNLFRPWFKDWQTWQAWRAFIAGAFGLPMEPHELALYTRCTGRASPPAHPATEAWIVAGRRSGKSFVLALIAVYLATFRDWRPHLAPGERATVMVLACDKRQARVIMRYILALLREVPLLAQLVERERDTAAGEMAVDLEGRVTIEVHTASFRSVRGYTVCAALLDEIAFWRSEDTANPDVEVLEAIRPALATMPGSMLLAASSPYSRRGALWEAHRRYYAQEGEVLVWQADTRTMNPTVSDRVIMSAEERDPVAAESEWHARFRSDLESYVDRLAVEACIEVGCRERPRVQGVQYVGFVDPSGGRQDSMTLAVAHREGEVVVLDLLREHKPPLDPAGTAREFAGTIRSYGLSTATADRYGAEWVSSAFREHGIVLRPADKPKSDLYRELLPVINSRRAALLDSSRLLVQLCGLERRVGRGGRDSIDHAPGARDDVANACAGALVGALLPQRAPVIW